MDIVPVRLGEAQEFVANFHRHNRAPQGGLFAIGLDEGGELVGVAIVGRCVARRLDDLFTAEVTRCCVKEGHKGGCSALYAACWRAWKAMGGRKLITYTLQSEGGASLRGAGWKIVAELPPNKEGQWQNRPGREWQPVVGQAKFRWETG